MGLMTYHTIMKDKHGVPHGTRKTQKSEYDIYEILKDNYGASTPATNYFEGAISRIAWDKVFAADGETYYTADCGFALTVENINPFQQQWKPTVLFSDGSMVEIN